jgi:DNA-binding CsgD family transcriptional regulator
LDTPGYGVVSIGGRPVRASRAAWEEAHGPIPTGLQVLHKCDMRCCVNPGHLFLGTHADNMADMAKKGRCPSLRGERHPQAKLSDAQRLAILADSRPQSEIARSFGIGQSMVSMLKSGARKVL